MAKVQTQGITMKDPRIDELKPKAPDPQPANNSSGNAETSEKAQKKFKKSFQKEKHKQKNFCSGIYATGINTTFNNIKLKSSKKDLFRIIYYNYNKKKYYV